MNIETPTTKGSTGSRDRNTRLVTLTEGDILIDDDTMYHVAHGEVSVYADRTIDQRDGELAEVSVEAVQFAIAAGRQVFNMEDAA